ncbi:MULTISPECIES: Na+/H+ antiporter [unclassified Curtobacterium]|uniref:Na+/H+ antiporter n=1 Tax=unclassified Curtobacterium TaxID=257496 RepID=UPI00052A71AC|nr:MULTISPECIES: Na+/H+ antiporter [unclassified Curtobacterium]AIV40103.1 sodium:proton antiporter [Curtobacterium sp. MR_MD2014]MDP9737012.1 CPA1 family monovalent cation:H+ antiporter [Curtobacterium sp. 260]
MLGPELVVALGLAIAVTAAVADRIRIAPPVLLLVIGALLAFVPTFGRVELPAEAVLLLFLPALLYWESLTTSLREIRKNLRGIVLMGTLLVVVTAGVVATLLHLLGMPWGPAWVLGAAVAPTDATAVGVLTKMLPRRNVTVLRAESLVNDGTTLVVYGIAVAVTVGTQELTFWNVSGMLVLSYVGGVAAGLLAAWLGSLVLRRVDTVVLENLVTLLVPFAAFLGAEAVGASGVLAVVAAGIVVSQVAPKLDRAETRQQVRAFWSFLTYLLNGALFVLVGIEAMVAARALDARELWSGVGLVLAVSVVLVLVRFAFEGTIGGTVWLVTRRFGGEPREGRRDRLVSGFAGFRGAVSLAMAVAVPRTLESGGAFPDRDLIVFVTAGVVVVTIVGQALVLPAVLRRAALPEDESVGEERRYAERTAVEEALDALPRLARRAGADRATIDRVRRDLEAHLDVIQAREEDDEDHPTLQRHDATVALELALVRHKAATLLRLRDDDEIDDLVLRQVRAGYDAEEARLEGSTPT